MPEHSERYAIEQALGMGALCEISRARGPAGEPLVLKRLHRHCAHDPELVAMFQHEARVLAALHHPGVPRLVDSWLDGDRWALALAYIEGSDLATVFAQSPVARLVAGVEVGLQLLASLAHAHTRRDPSGEPLAFVHRDVAPANVIVGPSGALTLIDWGLATSVWRPDPDRGRMKGTRGYMAPEVVTGEGIADARSDLFAVGVMVYELTVGRRLYPGSSMEAMVATVDGPVPSPLREVQDYPVELDAVLQRALAKRADDRYPSAEAMATALNAAASFFGSINRRAAVASLLRR